LRLLRRLLEHPLTRGRPLDEAETTVLRRELIWSKPFLRRIYEDWYNLIRERLPPPPGAVVELGSGAGFLRELMPELITSDVMVCPGVQLALDAQRLPFADASLRGLAMVDVLHHLPRCRRFFAEAARCVRAGGAIVAVEPWVTAWSRIVYGRLHHEPFLPDAATWEFPRTGPLSSANQALPWILFERDRSAFEREFPQWRVGEIRPMMPVRYLLSGGVGLRALVPCWAHPLAVRLEALLAPLLPSLAMFACVVLHRTAISPPATSAP